MTFFELLEGKEITEFVAYIIIAFAIGGLLMAIFLGYVADREKNTIQAEPTQWQPDVYMLQQMAYQNNECGVCLPKCFQVYNMTRQFGKTVYAVEQGWVK